MPSVRRILLVESDDDARARIAAAVSPVASVDGQNSFEAARDRLRYTSFDILVTNLRLKAYNGLHLVYLISSLPGAARAIVYADHLDAGLAREVQRAGAFFELIECLPVTLPGYLIGALPEDDRRGVGVPDRRKEFRGGRRSWDLHLSDLSG